MKFTSEAADRIIQALSERGAPKNCASCGHLEWTLAEGFVFLTVEKDLTQRVFAPTRGLPSAAV